MLYTDENNKQFYGNTLVGKRIFRWLSDMKTKNYLKGGDAIILASFQGNVFNLMEIHAMYTYLYAYISTYMCYNTHVNHVCCSV